MATFEENLDSLFASKEAGYGTRRERIAESATQCSEILNKLIQPRFDLAEKHLSQRNIDASIKSSYISLKEVVFLEIRDLEGNVVAPELIASCDLDNGVVIIDVGAVDAYEFDYDIDEDDAVRLFRAAAKAGRFKYGALTEEVVEKIVLEYIKHFL